MKAVLISINPRWCELIASGKKVVELRKTKPKLKTPFKCYIYETKDKEYEHIGVCGYKTDGSPYHFLHGVGKVIGEFICKGIEDVYQCNSGWAHAYACIPKDKFFDYLGIPQGTHLGYDKKAFGWLISDLVIYDKPKELKEFKPWNRTEEDCYFSHLGYAIPKCADCHVCYVKRPPQSWCYVEERSNR